MRREAPEPWASAMIRANITDPRYSEPRPSMNKLAQLVGVHTSTITSMVFGERATDQRIIDSVARALDVEPATIADWVGRAVANPYEPPATASLMSAEQRLLVDGIIRQFTRAAAASSDDTDTLRTSIESSEGVARLDDTEARRELRRVTSLLRELVNADRRLTPDEAELVLTYTQAISRLEARLNPPPGTGSRHVSETG